MRVFWLVNNLLFSATVGIYTALGAYAYGPGSFPDGARLAVALIIGGVAFVNLAVSSTKDL